MLPQLHPGVRPAAPLRQEAERRAVRLGRQHRAGGEVDAQADHVGGVDAAGLEHRRDGLLEDLEVVVRVLQRPVRFQAHAAGSPAAARRSRRWRRGGHKWQLRGRRRHRPAAPGPIRCRNRPRLHILAWFPPAFCGCARLPGDGAGGDRELIARHLARRTTRRSVSQSGGSGNKNASDQPSKLMVASLHWLKAGPEECQWAITEMRAPPALTIHTYQSPTMARLTLMMWL